MIAVEFLDRAIAYRMHIFRSAWKLSVCATGQIAHRWAYNLHRCQWSYTDIKLNEHRTKKVCVFVVELVQLDEIAQL
jgi:hypothetical protein